MGGKANDTFNAGAGALGAATFTALDTLDGGEGTGDVLNILQTAAYADIASASVKNIETANITSAADVNANVSKWTGLTQLNVTSSATAAETITAATTTGVTIANSTAFGVTVVGGGKVGTVTNGAAAIVIGKAAAPAAADANAYTSVTTSGGTTVNVTDNSGTAAGVADGSVGSTLTTVSLTGNTGAATLTGKGITNVTIANGAATSDVTITNATASHTQNLTLNNNATGLVIKDAAATTVNIATTGKASAVAIDAAAATALNVTGDVALTLDTVGADYTALKTVNLNGTGAVNADLSGAAALTAVNASASTGANTVKVDGTKATYTGGSGVDTVTVAAAPTKALNGGAGTADVINLAGAGATLLTNTSKAFITGFEVLSATGGSGNYDVALLSGITGLTQGATAAAVTYNNVTAGTGLTITAAPGFATAYNLANVAGTTDAFALTVSSAAAVNTGAVTANGIEAISIASTDTDTTQHQNTVNVASNAVKSLVITGNAGVALTAADTTITSVDASALSLTGTVAANAGFTWTSGAVVDNLVVKGSATGGDNIDVSAAATAGKTTSVTVYTGTNTVTGSALVDTITGGTGADTINTGAGNDVIVSGGGADVITAGAGADKITVSGNTWTITQALATGSGANTATTIQTSQLTSTFDVVYGAVAGGKIDLGNADIATAQLTLAATNLATGADDTALFARGTYDAAAGTFTYASNGADTALTYDADATAAVAGQTIILVGYVAGATTTAAAGVLTLV